MLTRLRSWFLYRFDELFSRGTWGKFMLLGIFTGLILLLGMSAGLVGLFSPENEKVSGVTVDIDGGVIDALVWSFHHILDPGFFFESYGATWPVLVISLAVSLGGMIVFGALVGFISSALDERLEVLRRGESAVQEQGHFLVLGWNSKAPEVIRLLIERHHAPCIVVLASLDADRMREDLRIDGVADTRAKIVLRSGAPDSHVELERVACVQAAGVIILPGDHLAPAVADAQVVRTLLILECLPWGARRPRIVAEVGHTRHLEAARLAGAGAIPVIATGEAVALLLFQCSRQRRLSQVFDRIIAPRGASILVRPAPSCTGLRFGDLVYAYPTAIPMGISRREAVPGGRDRYTYTLNPPRNHMLAEDEWLVLLARGEEEPQGLDRLRFRSSVSLNHTIQGNLPQSPAVVEEEAYHSSVSTGMPLPPPASWKVLILGWNEHLPPLLTEYDRCQGAPAEILVVSGHDPEEAAGRLRSEGVVLRRIAPVFQQADTLLPGVIAGLHPERYDAVVMLADASWADHDPDARTVMCLVVLREHLRANAGVNRPRISAEVVDRATGEAAAGLGIDDLVVGPHLISQILVQIAEQSMVAAIYDDLLSSGGMDLYLKPAGRYVRMDTPCTFRDVIYSAQHLDEVALGIWLSHPVGDLPAGLHVAPDKFAKLTLGADDQVVVLARELYDLSPGS